MSKATRILARMSAACRKVRANQCSGTADRVLAGLEEQGRGKGVELMRRSAALLSVVMALIVAACGLPSQPLVDPVAVRMEGDALVVLLPICSEVLVTAATVAPFLADDYDPDEAHWWHAKGYQGKSRDGVKLDPQLWDSSAGPAPHADEPMGFNVWTGDVDYGGVLEKSDVEALRDLGDKYLVDGSPMAKRDFLQKYANGEC
jgi:hypothetical protein